MDELVEDLYQEVTDFDEDDFTLNPAIHTSYKWYTICQEYVGEVVSSVRAAAKFKVSTSGTDSRKQANQGQCRGRFCG